MIWTGKTLQIVTLEQCMTVRWNLALEDAKKQEPDSTSLTYL